MGRMLAFIAHLFWAMLKGFFITGLVAAVICAVVLFITEPNHQITVDTTLVFSLVIALLAGVLGAAVALIYHLSHLDSVHHTVQRYSETRAAQRQRRSSARS
jgi:uncharacterized membrane protein YoaK (UPF0700 family)